MSEAWKNRLTIVVEGKSHGKTGEAVVVEGKSHEKNRRGRSQLGLWSRETRDF